MSCIQCERVPVQVIKTPQDLRLAISKAADALASNVLKYEGAGEWGDPFMDLARGGHWGDRVSNYFSCSACGQLFHLSAETYHGSGGAFQKVESIKERLVDVPPKDDRSGKQLQI